MSIAQALFFNAGETADILTLTPFGGSAVEYDFSNAGAYQSILDVDPSMEEHFIPVTSVQDPHWIGE